MRSTDLAISFFTFLTVLANLATIGIVGLAAAARWSPAGRVQGWWAAVRGELAAGGLGLAWLVAAVATSGSLWFSEVAGFQPCRLCWIQRACMYPLTLVLPVVALARRRAAAGGTDGRSTGQPQEAATAPAPAGPAATLGGTLPAPSPSRGSTLRAAHLGGLTVALAAVGAAVATYHVLLERFPSLEAGACDPQVPCTLVWFERLGFITLPYMALSGFVLILALVGASHVRPQEIAA